MKLDYEPASITKEINKIKAMKEMNKEMKKETKEIKTVKDPKTIKVSTLIKASLIITAIVAAYILGAISANKVSAMIDKEAEARASALLKLDGKQ